MHLFEAEDFQINQNCMFGRSCNDCTPGSVEMSNEWIEEDKNVKRSLSIATSQCEVQAFSTATSIEFSLQNKREVDDSVSHNEANHVVAKKQKKIAPKPPNSYLNFEESDHKHCTSKDMECSISHKIINQADEIDSLCQVKSEQRAKTQKKKAPIPPDYAISSMSIDTDIDFQTVNDGGSYIFEPPSNPDLNRSLPMKKSHSDPCVLQSVNSTSPLYFVSAHKELKKKRAALELLIQSEQWPPTIATYRKVMETKACDVEQLSKCEDNNLNEVFQTAASTENEHIADKRQVETKSQLATDLNIISEDVGEMEESAFLEKDLDNGDFHSEMKVFACLPSRISRHLSVTSGHNDVSCMSDQELSYLPLPQTLLPTMSGDEGKMKAMFGDLYHDFYRDQLLSSPQYKLSGWSKWKHEQSKRWKRSKRQFNEFLDNFEIWRGSFKVIDGNFGSSVVAYFRFVKWLLLLNLLSTLLVLGAVVLPQAAMEPATFNDSLRMALNQSTETTSFQDDALNCSAQYENYIEAKNNLGATQKLIDFFQGTGWMEHTILFAGYYFNKTYFYEEEPRFFNMPLAYLLVPTVYLFLSLIFMVDHTSSGVKEKLVTQGDKFYRSCNKVFCGWDFSLCEEKAAALKHNSLYYEYFHDLADERRAAARRGQSTARRAVTAAVRAAVWLFVVCVWAGAIYLIFRVVADWTPELLRRDAVAASQWLTLVVEFLPSISMTALNAVFPPIFGIVAQFEGYEPASEVRVTIARTVMLRLLSIGVLVFTLTNQISNCDVGVTCGVCDTIRSHCWETHVGQEFYKLVILDFLVVVGITFFLEFPRKFIVRKFYDKNKLVRLVGYQEFIIPKEVLIIVYSQTICWLGGFFSPLIPAITVAKFLIFFYCKKLTLLHNCVPAARQYRASSSNYFFMLILMISFGLCLVFIFYCVGRIPPSQGCGPFRVYTQEPFYMYQVITNAIGNIPFFLQRFISIVWNWIAYFILLIILALTIYYYRAIASGNRRMIELLKDQLALEGKDKQFLLSRVNDALMRGDIHGRSQ